MSHITKLVVPSPARRARLPLLLAAAAAALGGSEAARAGYVYESGNPATTPPNGGSGIGDGEFVGVRFQVTSATSADHIGGVFFGNSPIFGALVKLTSTTDVPDSSNLSTADVLAHTSLPVTYQPSETTAAFSAPVNLAAGWYAMVFGTGLFGTTGWGGATDNNPQNGNPSYFYNGGVGTPWQSQATSMRARFFIGVAKDKSWNTAAGGTWQTAANWNTSGAPDGLDDATFALGTVYTVDLAARTQVRNLNVQSDFVTVATGGHALDVSGDVTIGGSGEGFLAVNDGTLNQSGFGTFTVGATSNGTLNLSNATINAPNATLLVGRDAGGSAGIINGTVNTGEGRIAYDPSVEAGIVTGSGSVVVNSGGTWNIDGDLDVGRNGAGDLGVGDGGFLAIANTLRLHNTAGTSFGLTGGTIQLGVLDTDGNPSRVSWTAGTMWFTGGTTFAPTKALGNLTLKPGMILRTDAGFAIEPAGVLTVAGGTLTTKLTVVCNGTFTQTSGQTTIDGLVGGSLRTQGFTSVTGGTYSAKAIFQNSVTVGGTGSITIAAGGGAEYGASRITTLNITGNGKLDLKDNNLVLANATRGTWNGLAYTGVTGLLARGHNGGISNWGGTGIVTGMQAAKSDYTSLGVATAGELGRGGELFGGVMLEPTDVIIKYTYGGDANLDGVINIDDYTQIDSSVSAGGALKGWLNGDFNYDGNIDIDDYTIIDSNIGIQGAPFTAAAPLAGFSNAAVTAVPEPAICAAPAAIGALLTLRRRRRRAADFYRGDLPL